ncbi:hypothetical protein LEMLEM_LOCUS25350 [Lemmus lemmus]
MTKNTTAIKSKKGLLSEIYLQSNEKTRNPREAKAPPTWREARGTRTDNRHTKEAKAGPARPGYREALARNAGAGRFQNQPAWWGRGRGGRERGPPSSSGGGGNSNPSRQLHSVIPSTRRDERPRVWVSQPSAARPRSHSTYPWTPFSRLPPRSLNVRLPLAVPLGAALRRREIRNLGRYHRARPRGWARRFEPVISRALVPETGDPILSKEQDVTRGLRKTPQRPARSRASVEARGLEWLRPLALGTVSEESVQEGDGGWREGWGKGSRPGTTAD